ncbi:hypothetical protein BHE74_00018957 [Ensete ventricosum]|nr:hypothetical protein GW17_00039055 [Ensete ventricosum]RWW73185.1 hypothetical protein BHE74_00018957 [Ensete ventricosum]
MNPNPIKMCSEVWSAYALIESDPLRSPTATCILSNFKLSNDLKKRSLPVLSFPRLPPYPLAVPNEGGHRTLELGASCRKIRSKDEESYKSGKGSETNALWQRKFLSPLRSSGVPSVLFWSCSTFPILEKAPSIEPRFPFAGSWRPDLSSRHGACT